MNEKENTFRKIADDTLLIKSAWCYVKLHKWTQWSDPKKYNRLEIQVRSCANCNEAQVRTVEIEE
jgi:hypothetical protein